MTLLQNIKGNTAPPPKTMATNLSGQPSSNFKKILIIVLDKKGAAVLCNVCLWKNSSFVTSAYQKQSHYPYDPNLHSEGKSLTFKNCSGLQLSSN